SDGTPLKEAIDRHDATPHSISLPEHRKPHDTLSLGVDGSPVTPGVLAPMWDQPPLDKIKGAFAGLMVLPNDKQFLARRTVVARGDVAHAAIADIQALHNGEAKRPRTLDDAATHASRSISGLFDEPLQSVKVFPAELDYAHFLVTNPKGIRPFPDRGQWSSR